MKPEDAKKIISTAIDREVEAYTFYRGIADKVKDASLKKLFAELAGEEKQHREFLQGMLTKDVSKMKFDASHDYKIADMLPSPPLTADLKPIDGIVISIRKELEAMVKDSSAESIFIYGGAVKILVKKDPAATVAGDLYPDGELPVKAGDAVGILIRGRGITVTLTGSAMEDGRMGDSVRVRIKGNRTVKGRVAENKMVEVSL